MRTLSLDEFCRYVEDSLEIDQSIHGDTLIFEDLAFDSLSVYEFLVAVEDLGVEIDELAWTESTSISSCYQIYRDASKKAERLSNNPT